MLETDPNLQTEPARVWFVLYQERYRGPYSRAQLLDQLELGSLNPATLVWREGMTDWQPITEIVEFQSQNKNRNYLGATTWDSALDDDLWLEEPSEIADRAKAARYVNQSPHKLTAKLGPNLNAEPENELWAADIDATEAAAVLSANHKWNHQTWADLSQPTTDYDPTPALSSETVMVDPASLLPKSVQYRMAQKKSQIFTVRNILVSGIAMMFIAGVMMLSIHRVRLDAYERLPDVSSIENRELRATLNDSLVSHGAEASIALSLSDPLAPFFYIATNLADGSRFEIHVDGIQDTLLDRLVVSVRAPVTVKDGIARSPQLRQDNGQPFPRGEYRIAVICTGCPSVQNGAMLARKTYFLGGTRDRDYDQRLKAFHEQLRQSAQNELIELRQLSDTLDGQLGDSVAQFTKIMAVLHRNKSVPWPGKTWPEFHPQWLQLQAQIDTLTQQWTPQDLQKNFFYHELYTATKQLSELIKNVHGEQTEYLMGKKEDLAREAKIELDGQTARSALQNLRTRVAAASKVPATANGMPQRPVQAPAP